MTERDPRLNPKLGDEWSDDDLVYIVTIVGTKRIQLENKAYRKTCNIAISTFKNKCIYDWTYQG